MFKLKILCCIIAVGAIIFDSCNNKGNKKNITMSYADHRISFIVLKADCFSHYDTNFFRVNKNSLQFIKKIQERTAKITNPENAEFFKWEKRYDTAFDYTAYANARLKGIRKKIEILSTEEEFTEDDIEFLQLTDLYLNCSAYFKASWYMFPEIKFSETFYYQFFKQKEEKLFNHYLYDDDTTSEFRLSVAYKYPGKYDYIPAPHVIDKIFATELLGLLKTNSNNIDSSLIDEAEFFKEILEGVVKEKYLLIIKTYM